VRPVSEDEDILTDADTSEGEEQEKKKKKNGSGKSSGAKCGRRENQRTREKPRSSGGQVATQVAPAE